MAMAMAQWPLLRARSELRPSLGCHGGRRLRRTRDQQGW